MLDKLEGPDVVPRGLLLGWALWWSVVVLSNVTDLLQTLGLLGPEFTWTSGNYGMMAEGSGGGGPGLIAFFAFGIAWEALSAGLFWRAVRQWRTPGGRRAARVAFAVSVAFWFAFLIANELALLHKSGDGPLVHWIIFTAQVVSFLAMGRLDDPPETAAT